MQGHKITKIYVARVQGCFPEDEQRAEAPLCWDPKLNLASVTQVGHTFCMDSLQTRNSCCRIHSHETAAGI